MRRTWKRLVTSSLLDFRVRSAGLWCAGGRTTGASVLSACLIFHSPGYRLTSTRAMEPNHESMPSHPLASGLTPPRTRPRIPRQERERQKEKIKHLYISDDNCGSGIQWQQWRENTGSTPSKRRCSLLEFEPG